MDQRQCPVLPFLDDDGEVRLGRVYGRRGDRVQLMVTRAVGMTHLVKVPAHRLLDARSVEAERR